MWKRILLTIVFSFIFNVQTAEADWIQSDTADYNRYTSADGGPSGARFLFYGFLEGSATGTILESNASQTVSIRLRIPSGFGSGSNDDVNFNVQLVACDIGQAPTGITATSTSAMNASCAFTGVQSNVLQVWLGGGASEDVWYTPATTWNVNGAPTSYNILNTKDYYYVLQWNIHNTLTAHAFDISGATTTDPIYEIDYIPTGSPTAITKQDIVVPYLVMLGDYFDVCVDGTECEIPDFTTRIIDFNPQDGEVASSSIPIPFSLDAYINENDVGTVSTIQITLENIDQNVLLLGFLSPSQFTLVDEAITEGGYFSYSTSTIYLAEGNYRVEACIKRTFFGGIFGGFFESGLVNFFSDISDCQSHQFIVGTSTFIGNISQNLWSDTNAFLEGLSATSSEALASTCNPLNLNFDVRQCIVFLTVPDANSLAEVLNLAREGILSRWPWGYGTRFVQILTNSPTSTLPSVTIPILVGTGEDTTLSFDFVDMVAGGGALLDQATDPTSGLTLRQVTEPFVILFIALLVVIIIVNDLMKIGRDRDNKDIQNNKYQ